MFGSLKINGTKIVRELSLRDALPGFLVITKNHNKDVSNAEIDIILLKTKTNKVVNITNQMCWGVDATSEYASAVYVGYLDVEFNYKPVVE